MSQQYDPPVLTPSWCQRYMATLGNNAELVMHVTSFISRLSAHREIMQSLYNELELIDQEFAANDKAREDTIKDRERQAQIIDKLLEAAFKMNDPGVINNILSTLNKYQDGTPNYQERTINFIRGRKTPIEA